MGCFSSKKAKGDKVLYAHASRILHHESHPGRALRNHGKDGDRYVWINPPAIPLSTEEMGQRFCAAVQARAASGLWQCPYSGLRN
ncbi:hypothetical protein ACLB1T_06800 [Escherichia coli]